MSKRRRKTKGKREIKGRRERKDRERKRERTRRELARIRRDIRGWIGWDFIEECTKRSKDPALIMTIFLTGGRATEVLELTRGHFADMGPYYEVRGMPVFKKYDVIEVYEDEEGNEWWETELVTEYRTFPILKSEPLAEPLWESIKDREGKLFEFRTLPSVTWENDRPITVEGGLWADQYWQLYKTVAEIDVPESPLAPMDDTGNQKNIYPHWLRGMRAAQMRVEYALTADDLMEFFKWEDPEMALYYTSLTSRELADKMIRGRDTIRRTMRME